jgi:hypothetical protein
VGAAAATVTGSGNIRRLLVKYLHGAKPEWAFA